MALTQTQVSELYVAIFNRASEGEGNKFWQQSADAKAAANSMLDSQPAKDYFGTAMDSNQAFIKHIYKNTLNKTYADDKTGIDFWVNALNSGMSRGEVVASLVAAVANYSSSTDPVTKAAYDQFNNRVAVSNYTADTLEKAPADYKTSTAFVTSGTTGLVVTNSASTVTTAKKSVQDLAIDGKTFTLTSGADNFTGTTSNDKVDGLISAIGTSTTFNSTDNIIDTTTTDNDTFNLTVSDDVAQAATGLVRGIENVNVNIDAITTAAASPLVFNFDAANFTNTKNYVFDATNSSSVINTLTLTNVNDNNAKVTASTDFTTVNVAGKAGNNVTVDAKAAGNTGAPVNVTVTAATGNVEVIGAGHLAATANTAAGLVKATAVENLSLGATAANVINATSTNGNVSVTDATASVNTTVNAKGNVDISKLDAAGSVTVVAGGTINLAGSAGVNSTSLNLSGVGTSKVASAANAVTVATLSGNGAAATYDMIAGATAMKDVIVTGSQDVTLKLDASKVNTNINVADNSTAGKFTLDLGTAAGNVDLTGSSSLIDVLKLSVDNNAQTLKVKDTQAVTVAVNQTATTIAVGTAANAASQSVTIKLDDGVKDNNAIDINSLTVTQAKTVTIDMSTDTTAAGTAVTNKINTLNASGANSNVTINQGVNNLELQSAGTTTVGTGSITVTGSGTLTDAAGVTLITAATLDASAMTGAVTLDSTTTLAVGTIKTGSGNDTVVLTQQADVTVSMGAGNDILTLDDTSTVNKVTNIDLGTGTDTLKFVASTELLKGTGTLTVSGVETLNFLASNNTMKVQSSVLNGATYNYEASAANSTSNVAVVVDASETVVDLSKLVGSLDAVKAVAGMTFTTDASAATSAVTVSGVLGAKNVITGSANAADVLTGGNKSDIFNYASETTLFDTAGTMLDTIAGGTQEATGSDTLKFTSTGAAVTIKNTDVWSKISGVESITTAANTAAITLALDVSAGTAGLTTVDLSGDADVGGDNVIDLSEFTVASTIKGSTGKDTITGGTVADTITLTAGADVIKAGAGDDTIKALLTADLFNGTALVNGSINGETGTDTLLVGTNGTAFAIANNDVWTNVTNIETIKSVENTAAVTLALDTTAWASGVRTIDISAAKAATGNTIDVSEITATEGVSKTTTGYTLTGSATGVTTITGSNGIDTIKGGSANDIFDGKAGNDIISLAEGGTDTVVLSKANGAESITSFTAGASTTVGYDKLQIGLAGANNLESKGIATNAVTISATNKITVINSILSTSLANDDTGTSLIAALTASNGGTAVSITANANTDVGYLVAYQGGNAYIYHFDAAGGDTTVAANEISLIGTLSNVSTGTLVADNFIA